MPVAYLFSDRKRVRFHLCELCLFDTTRADLLLGLALQDSIRRLYIDWTMAPSYQHEDPEALLADKDSSVEGNGKNEETEESLSPCRRRRMHAAMSLTILMGCGYAYVLLFWP